MSSNKHLSSKEKLMIAAIDLISAKGYKGVTTQEIATEAGLSEKTLFRHFGTKQNLLETAFDHFHYTEEMKELFNNKLLWDLQTDLLLISRTYHEFMNRNRKMFIISIKEDNLPGFKEKALKNPHQLMDFLTNYFTEMFKKGKLIQTNPQMQAYLFMTLNYGAFTTNLDSRDQFPTISLEEFIVESVQTFTRALTP